MITLVMALAIAAQQEHPWEVRLRDAEAKAKYLEKYVEQATKEANAFVALQRDVIKNHRERLEHLEKVERERQQALLEENDPVTKSDVAASNAAEAKEKTEALADRVEEVAKQAETPVKDAVMIGLGGAAGIATIVSTLSQLAIRRLRRELEMDVPDAPESSPEPSPEKSAVVPTDIGALLK